MSRRNVQFSDLPERYRVQVQAQLEPKVAETLKERKPRSRPEGELQDEVIEHLQGLGYLVAHFRAAKTEKGWRTPVEGDGAGYPDITAVHPRTGACLILEVKSEEGTISDAQATWLGAWQGVAGAAVLVVRPSSWRDIKRWLR